MEKEFIPYQLALKVKELGFDEPTLANYVSGTYGFDKLEGKLEIWDDEVVEVLSFSVRAPLYQQAFDWFRNNYNMNCQIRNSDKYFFININKVDYFNEIGKSIEINKPFKTYEEARLECLKKLIQLVTL